MNESPQEMTSQMTTIVGQSNNKIGAEHRQSAIGSLGMEVIGNHGGSGGVRMSLNERKSPNVEQSRSGGLQRPERPPFKESHDGKEVPAK